MDNKTFYEAVRNATSLKPVLDEYALSIPEPKSLRYGPILQIRRETWKIEAVPGSGKGVHLHFECTNARKLHLHIETYPYVPSLDDKPDELSQRQAELAFRERLHRKIRPALLGLTTVQVIGPDAGHPTEKPSANSAGSFPSDLPDDCSPEAYAGFVARVIEAVVPTVDRCIAEVPPAS